MKGSIADRSASGITVTEEQAPPQGLSQIHRSCLVGQKAVLKKLHEPHGELERVKALVRE